jgi:hypothetical protein
LAIASGGDDGWATTLALWQCKQSRHQTATCALVLLFVVAGAAVVPAAALAVFDAVTSAVVDAVAATVLALTVVLSAGEVASAVVAFAEILLLLLGQLLLLLPRAWRLSLS